MVTLASIGQYAPVVLRARTLWRSPVVERGQRGIYRIALVRKGDLDLEMRDHEHRKIRAGQMLLLSPLVMRSLTPEPGSISSLIAFTATPCKLTFSNTNAANRVLWNTPRHVQASPREIWGVDLPLILDPDLTERIRFRYRNILDLWWKGDWQHFKANMRLCELLEDIVSHYRADENTAAHDEDSFESRVDQLLENHIGSIEGVTDMAKAFNMGKDHFTRVFKKKMGCTPAVHLRNRRLALAAELLKETDLPVQTISERIGYGNVVSFNQAWARQNKVPPLLYRRERYF